MANSFCHLLAANFDPIIISLFVAIAIAVYNICFANLIETVHESMRKYFNGEMRQKPPPSETVDPKLQTESETSIMISERQLLPFVCSSLFKKTPQHHEDINTNEGQACSIVSSPDSKIEFKN